jgi:hypothetical protein
VRFHGGSGIEVDADLKGTGTTAAGGGEFFKRTIVPSWLLGREAMGWEGVGEGLVAAGAPWIPLALGVAVFGDSTTVVVSLLVEAIWATPLEIMLGLEVTAWDLICIPTTFLSALRTG